ncbi:MAG: HIRAN domain-containing protein [Janthinobacterium lividum]
MIELSLAVVGIDYPNPDGSNRRFHMALLDRGDPVELRREPGNKFDPHAVGVFGQDGIRIGYLPAGRAPFIGSKILDGLEVQAIFQEREATIGVIRARIGGGPPTLPPERPRTPRAFHGAVAIQGAQAESVFYPDEDGPEWGA